MKKNVFVSVLCGTLLAAAAVAAPCVQIQSIEVAPDVPHLVTVTYTLSEDAIVTASFLTNGVALADGAVDTVFGDVNRKIAATGSGEVRTIGWTPDASFGGQALDASKVTAKLTAWTLDSPPDYLVADLRVPSNICWYASEDALPGKVTDRVYKEHRLVMRRIHAKDVHWIMGSSSNYWRAVTGGGSWGPKFSNALAHRVRLTRDYYIGVYPVTAAQWSLVSAKSGATDDRSPRSWISYNDIRGSGEGAKWPQTDETGAFDAEASHAVDSTSWIAKFRAHTGLRWADLPTEAQYEFAARAGEKGLLPGGEDWTDANLSLYAKWEKNKSEPDCEGRTGSRATVGTYLPNRWGLYDVLGNALQWVLDYYVAWDDPVIDAEAEQVDPVGPATGTRRLTKGSCAGVSKSWGNYLGFRNYAYEPAYGNSGNFGFRLAVTMY